MKFKLGSMCALTSLAVMLASESVSAAALTLCGVLDETIQDLARPLPGVVRANCGVFAGITVIATAEEHVTPNRDLIVVSSTLPGAGTQTVSNIYPAFNGPGFLRVAFEGELEKIMGLGNSVGGETLTVSATASTFIFGTPTANLVPIAAGTPLPHDVMGAMSINGTYFGPGVLTGTFTWNAGAGQQFDFGSSKDFATAVPEPSTFHLLGIACLGLIAYCCRRRRLEVCSPPG